MFTKKIMAAATVAVASLTLTATASATISPSSGTLSANAPGVTLGTFTECDSYLEGSVTNNRAAGLGGQGQITDGEFTNCGFGQSATGNFSTPWTLDATPVSGNADASTIVASNVDVSVTVGFLNCRYKGTLNGTGSDSADTITLANSGGLALQSGSSFGCPTNPDVNGTWTFDQDVTVS